MGEEDNVNSYFTRFMRLCMVGEDISDVKLGECIGKTPKHIQSILENKEDVLFDEAILITKCLKSDFYNFIPISYSNENVIDDIV